MSRIPRIKNLITGVVLSLAVVAMPAVNVFAAPTLTPPGADKQPVTGPQSKAPFEPGTVDSKPTAKLGSTAQVTTDAQGKVTTSNKGLSALAGNVAGVDFQSPLNYCYRNLVYSPVSNTTASTQYVHVMLYNQGMYRGDTYGTIASGSTFYPAFYGIDGDYYAYLYVWNGSSYVYDEYVAGNNTCNVSVTRTYDTGGWVQLKIQNLGTAYATQVSSELATYYGSGTYTGTHYDYPVAGGAAIYRWFYVGYRPYGISSYTSASWNYPYTFNGDH